MTSNPLKNGNYASHFVAKQLIFSASTFTKFTRVPSGVQIGDHPTRVRKETALLGTSKVPNFYPLFSKNLNFFEIQTKYFPGALKMRSKTDTKRSVFDSFSGPEMFFACISKKLRFFEKGAQKVVIFDRRKVQFPYVLVWDGHRFILRMAHLKILVTCRR